MSSTSSFVTDTVTDMIPTSDARLQADDDKQIRPPFYHPDLIREVVLESPILLVGQLYDHSATLQQKQACLRYLLHYQHYNAEFTIAENDQLKYPQALYKPQEKPGYLRTEYNRLIELVEPCIIDSDFGGLYDISSGVPKEQRIKDFIKVSSTSAVTVLKTFFPQFCFGEINEIYPEIKKPGRKIIIVNLGPKDRLKDASTIVQ